MSSGISDRFPCKTVFVNHLLFQRMRPHRFNKGHSIYKQSSNQELLSILVVTQSSVSEIYF